MTRACVTPRCRDVSAAIAWWRRLNRPSLEREVAGPASVPNSRIPTKNLMPEIGGKAAASAPGSCPIAPSFLWIGQAWNLVGICRPGH